MLRLVGFVVVAMVVIGFFGPELQKLVELPKETAAPASAPPAVRPSPSGRVEVAANAGGHYVVTARVNGRPLTLLADTGATLVALRASDARAIGLVVLPGDYRETAVTANGPVAAARLRLQEIEIGGIRVTGVDALVLGDGALSTNLLGMSFLGRIGSFSIRDGRLTLVQ